MGEKKVGVRVEDEGAQERKKETPKWNDKTCLGLDGEGAKT